MDREGSWLDEAEKRYGVWPGGLYCALVQESPDRVPCAVPPLEVWTIEGERQVFVEHRTDHVPRRS
jgi:hypothetical protein